MKDWVLSDVPLDDASRRVLAEKCDVKDPRSDSLRELKQRGWKGLLAVLRLRPSRAILFPFARADAAVQDALHIVGGLVRARKHFIYYEETGLKAFQRREIVSKFFEIILASLHGLAHLCGLALRTVYYSSVEAMSVDSREEPDTFFYFRTGYSFGGTLLAGGSVGHVAGVVNGLLRRRKRVVVFAADRPPMLSDRAEIVRTAIPPGMAFPLVLNQCRYQANLARAALAASRTIRPSVVYERTALLHISGLVVSRRLRVPLICEYNGSAPWVAKNWGQGCRFYRLARWSELVCLRHAKKVVVVSEPLRDELVGRGIAPEKIIVYPNGVDPDVFDPSRFSQASRNELRRGLGIGPAARVVGFIGTMSQWHGVDVLAEMLTSVVDSEWVARHDVHFLLIGDGPLMSDLTRSVDGCRRSDRVHFTGLVPQAQAPQYLAASDILIAPHNPPMYGAGKFHGSPTKVFEYMSMGKGIVASNLAQLGDILQPATKAGDIIAGKADCSESLAVLIEPGNAEDLCVGIRTLVERPQLCEQMGKRAREKVLQHYTWDHHVQHILSSLP